MTLEQLRIFVAVAERQHMTKAAEALHLAQSAVSAAIAALEARHGARLFHRVGRGIELSDAGSLFLREARGVLARADAAEKVLSDLGGLKRGTLRVQASQTIASYWLPRHLVAFRQAYPGIDIRLAIGNTAQVAAAVHEGEAELGFVEGEISDPALGVVEVARDRMLILVGRGHAWWDAGAIGAAQFSEAEWVLREEGSGTRSVFEAALETLGIGASGLRVAMELPSNEAVRAAVEAGMGATALSASVAAPSLEAGLLYHVPFELPDRAFSAVRHLEREASKAGETLMEVIKGK
jgi:DNA-binding transcriptional LysR family regulator